MHKKKIAVIFGVSKRTLERRISSDESFGLALLRRVEADLQEHAVVEQFPKMEGRQMVMVLAPKKIEKVVAKAAKDKTSDKPAPKPVEKTEEKVVTE